MNCPPLRRIRNKKEEYQDREYTDLLAAAVDHALSRKLDPAHWTKLSVESGASAAGSAVHGKRGEDWTLKGGQDLRRGNFKADQNPVWLAGNERIWNGSLEPAGTWKRQVSNNAQILISIPHVHPASPERQQIVDREDGGADRGIALADLWEKEGTCFPLHPNVQISLSPPRR